MEKHKKGSIETEFTPPCRLMMEIAQITFAIAIVCPTAYFTSY